jgi:hypothetical protein
LRLVEAFIWFHMWASWFPLMVKIKQNKNLSVQQQPTLWRWCECSKLPEHSVYYLYLRQQPIFNITVVWLMGSHFLLFYIWFHRIVIFKLWPTQ